MRLINKKLMQLHYLDYDSWDDFYKAIEEYKKQGWKQTPGGTCDSTVFLYLD